RRWIAVGQIEARDNDVADHRLDIAAVQVLRVSRQHTSSFERLCSPREDRHAVPAFLAVPDEPVSCIAYLSLGKALLWNLQFLKTNNIGMRLFQPVQESRQSRSDAVDVVGGDLHDLAFEDAVRWQCELGKLIKCLLR